MNEINVPVQSFKTLMISVITAIVLAVFILLTAVGPAEYGIDPTGLGKKMGLTILAKKQEPENALVTCPDPDGNRDWRDVVVITVPPGKGLEYKLIMDANAELAYQWSTDGAELYYDFHGEPAGDTTGYFKSFEESTASQSSGEIITTFTGTHGWYWENQTQAPVNITLKIKGIYKVKGLL